MDTLKKYLASRRKTIEASIAAELLAGNVVKLQAERTALAEIDALEGLAPTWNKRTNEWVSDEKIAAINRVSVIAVKHCPRDHRDWKELLLLLKLIGPPPKGER